MKFFILSLFCLFSFGIFCQSSLSQKAQELYNQNQFEDAYPKFLELVEAEADNASAWFNKGRTELKLQKFDDAKVSFERALYLGFQPVSYIHFNLAKCFAQIRKPASAFEQLELAVNNGFSAFNRLESDVEFAPLLRRQEFQNILQKTRENAYPCLKDSNFNKFDFWLGEWDVFSRQSGAVAGYNSITKAVGGCAVHENYTTQRSYAGQSINFYDPIVKKWKQHWVGSSGDIVNFVETDHYDCSLQFIGESMQPDGSISLKRLSFTYHPENDTVQQFGEGSTDGGKSWKVEYDLIYRRKVQ